MEIFQSFLKISFLLLVCGVISYVAAKEGVEIVYTAMNCTKHDPIGILTHIDCYLGKSVKRRTLSMELKFNTSINHFLADLLIVLPRNGGDFVLLNLTKIDGCQLLSNKNQVPFMRLSRAGLNRYGNVPDGCPFKKDVLYYLRNYRVDLSNMPFSFETDMNYYFGMTYRKQLIFNGYLFSRIQMKGFNKKRN